MSKEKGRGEAHPTVQLLTIVIGANSRRFACPFRPFLFLRSLASRGLKSIQRSHSTSTRGPHPLSHLCTCYRKMKKTPLLSPSSKGKTKSRRAKGDGWSPRYDFEIEIEIWRPRMVEDEAIFSVLGFCLVMMTIMSAAGSSSGGGEQFPVGMRVLVVDDDVTCLKILDHMLQRCRYRGELSLGLWISGGKFVCLFFRFCFVLFFCFFVFSTV